MQQRRSHGININLHESDIFNLYLWVREETFETDRSNLLKIRNSGSGVEIVNTSEREVTVREGEALDLFCDSTSPYQVSGEGSVHVYSELIIMLNVAVVLLGAQWVRISDNLAQRRRGAQVSPLVTKNGRFMENVNF